MTIPPRSQSIIQPGRSPARVALAAAWLRAVTPTGYTAMERPRFEELVSGLVDRLAAVVAGEDFTPDAARPVGAALVRMNFTDPESLRVSLTVLGSGLLELASEAGVADPAERAFAVLGAFGAGYTAELRDWLFGQQEHVKLALQRATGEAERRLRRSEAWFREVFVRAAVGIAISDPGGKLAQVNPAMAEMLGVPADRLVGRGLDEFFDPRDPADPRSDADELAGLGGRPLRRRRRLVRPDGLILWAHLAVSVLRDTEEGSGDEGRALHLTMIENVSDLHLLQDLTSHQSLHDLLTGLPNRQYLLSQLQSALARQPAEGHVTLYHLDIDGFGTVTDGLGPEDGDRLLSVVARRLETLFAGRRALVARPGGEFAVLVPEGSGPAEVLETISDINEQLAEPVHLTGGGVGVSASIGVAHGRVGSIAPAELLRAADVTLRRARALGNRQWAEYDQHHDAVDRRTLALAATLSGAVEFGEPTRLWQPWTRFDGRGICGVSVQVRWEHPEYGTIGHQEVLDLAERTGAALQLGAWLVDEACERARVWRDRFGEAAPLVGVVLTASQTADPDLVGTVRAALTRSGIDPAGLAVGVPSLVLSRADGEARDNVGLLAALGVRVVLSDVGESMAELSLLDEVPVLAVRMAAPLVTRLADLSPDALVVRATAALVGALRDANVPVLVPALRTDEQAAWWRAAGAHAGCGDPFGPPRTEDEMARVLAHR